MAISPTLLNGRRFSFSSLEFSVVRPDGSSEIFIDVNSLNYSDSLAIEFVQGASQAPVGMTAGQYEPEDTTFTMTKSTFQKGLVEGIGDGWLGSAIRITAKYADVGEDITTDVIDCVITGASDAHASGPDALNVEVTCKTALITRNGVNPLLGL
jgi:hypothetical protein